MDRFALPDEPQVITHCAQCGGEIYVGDEVKRINNADGFVCNNFGTECATKYAEERIYDAIGTIDANGNVN